MRGAQRVRSQRVVALPFCHGTYIVLRWLETGDLTWALHLPEPEDGARPADGPPIACGFVDGDFAPALRRVAEEAEELREVSGAAARGTRLA